MKLADQNHPFYAPLWRRIVIVVTVLVWAGFEVVYAREPMWVMIAGGMAAYSLWTFIITWPKAPGPDSKP